MTPDSTPGTAVAPTASSEVAVVDPALQAILDAQEEELAQSDYQTPILKLCQALTREVANDEADAGDFFNTLSGESLGNKIEFIISYFGRGRSAADRDSGKFYLAFEDTIPDSWAPLVGEEFVGTRFDEYPDAEEQYKRRVNAGELPWGKGPLISTTYNYTGFVIASPPEGSDEEPELQPVRLSLSRSTKKASDKITTIKKGLLRGKPFWDAVFELESVKESNARGDQFYGLKVKKGRDTTPEEREAAVSLAQATVRGAVTTTGTADEGPVKPSDDGGLAV